MAEKHGKIVAIIQARMGSTRMPGKSLRPILGKPMLWHLVNRLKNSKTIDQIVVATTAEKIDSPILDLAEKMNVGSYAGSESDVLDRYYQSAKKYNADIVLRITADCPLIDPEIVDKLTDLFLRGAYDYAGVDNDSYPHGFDTEIFTFQALDKAWHEAKLASEREHVTPYIKKHLSFKKAALKSPEPLPKIRITVDYQDDFDLVENIYKELYAEDRIFHLKDILAFFKRHPDLLGMNQNHIKNEGYIKSLNEDKVIK